MIQRSPRYAAPLALGLPLFVIALTLGTSDAGDPALWPPAPDEAVTIYLVDNGAHSDIALPREALGTGPAARAAAIATAKPWIMVGFGDAKFFIDQGVSVGRGLDGLRALLAPGNPGALRFDGLAASPDRLWRDGVRPVRVSKAGLAAMAARIDRSLVVGPDGAPVIQKSPPAPDSRFFRSREHFSLLHLCNHWTGEVLSAAGLPTTPVLDTLPAGLAFDVTQRVQGPSGPIRPKSSPSRARYDH